jgi:hypothetical protein
MGCEGRERTPKEILARGQARCSSLERSIIGSSSSFDNTLGMKNFSYGARIQSQVACATLDVPKLWPMFPLASTTTVGTGSTEFIRKGFSVSVAVSVLSPLT